MKRCKVCKEMKDDNSFYNYSNYKDGMCKTCRNLYNQKWRQLKFTNKEYYHRKTLIEGGKNICRMCGEIKPLTQFKESKRVRNGYVTMCNTCRRLKYKVYRIKRNYGITPEIYQKIYQLQNGLCAICKTKLELKLNRTCVDHCHNTNKIRGLLCNRCNRVLGMLNDNTTILYSAIKYLKVAHVKLDELLETPEEDNQQPSSGSIISTEKVQRLTGE